MFAGGSVRQRREPATSTAAPHTRCRSARTSSSTTRQRRPPPGTGAAAGRAAPNCALLVRHVPRRRGTRGNATNEGRHPRSRKTAARRPAARSSGYCAVAASQFRLGAFLMCSRFVIFNTYVVIARPDRGTGPSHPLVSGLAIHGGQ